MRLYLIQHGEAKSKEQDPERPLTEKGLRDVRKVAEFIKPLGLRVRSVLHSGKARAAQTAEVLASAVDADEGIFQHDGLGPNDPVQPVAKDIQQATEDLMIVGHLPFLGKLAARLLTGSESAELVAFRNGGIVCLEHAQDGTWKLVWMIVPELILAFRNNVGT